MIYFLSGKPGSGKTYTMVKMAKEALESGRDVFANFMIFEEKLNLKPKLNLAQKLKSKTKNFQPPKLGRLFYFSKLEQFRYLHDGLILMDECQVYFNARKWATMDESDQIKFQQHRKHGLDIIACSQSFAFADSSIRRLSAKVYEVKKLFNIFILKQYDTEEIESKKRSSNFTEFYKFDKTIADSYNTNELIARDGFAEEYQKMLEHTFVPMSSFVINFQSLDVPKGLVAQPVGDVPSW